MEHDFSNFLYFAVSSLLKRRGFHGFEFGGVVILNFQKFTATLQKNLSNLEFATPGLGKNSPPPGAPGAQAEIIPRPRFPRGLK